MTHIANAATDQREFESGVVITREMVDAGVGALMSWNPDFISEEDAVRRIYGAMIKVACSEMLGAVDRTP